MSILHIDSSARLEASNSRRITRYLVDRLEAQEIERLREIADAEGRQPSDSIGRATTTRDVGQNLLPQINAQDLVDLHASVEPDRDSLAAHTQLSETLIAELKAADTLVIGAPLYNFGVPVSLKQWIDYVARAGQTFRYTAEGPVGLTGVKQAFVVVSSGGTPIGSAMDHVSAHLKTVLGFLGVERVDIIDASGSKGEPEQVIAAAQAQIDALIALPESALS
jgi:FMN-dependent NADH-azoreductase